MLIFLFCKYCHNGMLKKKFKNYMHACMCVSVCIGKCCGVHARVQICESWFSLLFGLMKVPLYAELSPHALTVWLTCSLYHLRLSMHVSHLASLDASCILLP